MSVIWGGEQRDLTPAQYQSIIGAGVVGALIGIGIMARLAWPWMVRTIIWIARLS
jgi:hypothetical protein